MGEWGKIRTTTKYHFFRHDPIDSRVGSVRSLCRRYESNDPVREIVWDPGLIMGLRVRGDGDFSPAPHCCSRCVNALKIDARRGDVEGLLRLARVSSVGGVYFENGTPEWIQGKVQSGELDKIEQAMNRGAMLLGITAENLLGRGNARTITVTATGASGVINTQVQHIQTDDGLEIITVGDGQAINITNHSPDIKEYIDQVTGVRYRVMPGSTRSIPSPVQGPHQAPVPSYTTYSVDAITAAHRMARETNERRTRAVEALQQYYREHGEGRGPPPDVGDIARLHRYYDQVAWENNRAMDHLAVVMNLPRATPTPGEFRPYEEYDRQLFSIAPGKFAKTDTGPAAQPVQQEEEPPRKKTRWEYIEPKKK